MTVMLFLAPLFPLAAQTSTSTISGIVTDMSGATVPGASVQVRNVGTGVVLNLKSDAEGRYRAPEVIVGNYEIRVTAQGFETAVRPGISTSVGGESIVDVSLSVGQAQQVVTVDAHVSQVDTSTSAISFTMDTQQMADLPMGTARNFVDLINFAPGVAAIQNGGQNNFYGQQGNYSVSGSRPTGLGFLIDSTNLTTFQGKSAGSGATGASLGIESLAQFQVLTNTYSAQYGGNGIVVNAASKSGTNTFHGSLYSFFGNSALNTRGEFDSVVLPGATRAFAPTSHTLDAGFSLGGPIKKDKLFFFANYELLRGANEATTINQNLPDALAHQGLLPCAVANASSPPPPPGTVAPPTITYTCNSAGYANVGFAPGIQSLMQLLPIPQVESLSGGKLTGLGTETQLDPTVNHDNYVLGRIDYTISDKDSIFMRVVSDQGYRLATPGIGAFTERDGTGNWYATLEERHIISPTMINLARVSFLRPQEIGTQSTPNNPALQLIPGSVDATVVVPSGSRVLGPNQSLPFNLTQDGYQAMDDVIWTHGGHNLKFGVGTTITQDFTENVVSPGGTLQFNTVLTFLQGEPSQLNAPLPGYNYPNRDMVEALVTPYIHDEWKVNRKLTLNMGVRYEWARNPSENRGNFYDFPSPLTNTNWVQIPHAFANNPTDKNFAPRFGFAYDPFADHKTSIRGGFGIFYDVMTGHIILPGFWGAYPFNTAIVTNPPWPDPYSAFQSAASALPTLQGGLLYGNGKISTPYAMQYNFNIQRELAKNTVLQVAYVGTGARHLLNTIERNPPQIINGAFGTLASNGSTTSNPRLNPALGSMGLLGTCCTSDYNALQVNLTRRFASHLSTQVSYAYSKSMDYGSSFSQNTAIGNNVNTEDPYDTNLDRGVSTFSRTHVLRINSVYELPFTRNQLVNGWKLSGIWTENTGAPVTIYTGFDRTGFGGNSGGVNRPDLAPGCAADPIVGTITEWFNPSCYVLQPVGTIGNVGRTTVVGPGFANLNLALLKDTRIPKISEVFDIQFRAEVANFANHPNLNLNSNGGSNATQIFLNGNTNANGTVGTLNPIAGVITQTIGSPRDITLALKVIF